MDVNRDIVRLLRFIGKMPATLAPAQSAGRWIVKKSPSESLTLASVAIEAAISQGLAFRDHQMIRATGEARGFLLRQIADREEAFLSQHRLVAERSVIIDGEPTTVRANLDESPLSQLARLKDRNGAPWFDAEAIAAGGRLARDFHYAALQPRLTMAYGPRLGDRPGSGGGQGVELTDSVLAARNRVNMAVAALGPELSGVALDICCFEKGLETVERERQWPARSAKLMLKTALSQLHRHYHPPEPDGRRRNHAWGAEGFRPEL